MSDKKADLAGPGIGDYDELRGILPQDYSSLLNPKETQLAVYAAKDYIEENLCKELNLIRVTVPLIVDVESGVNDFLDRDGSRTPIQFHIRFKHIRNNFFDIKVRTTPVTIWLRRIIDTSSYCPMRS
jgi:aspartate--ammonia ligase